MELTPKQKREVAVLDVCLSSESPISSVTIAAKLSVKSDSIYFGRKVQHIIGDLVYSKKLKRTELQVQVHGKTLPTYAVTEEGKTYLQNTRRSEAVAQPSGASSTSASFNIRKGNATDVVVAGLKSEAKRPVLSEAKILAPNQATNPITKVLPLPDKLAPKTPPYPAVGKPGLSSGAMEVKLRELVDSMKTDGGKEAFLNIARITLENEQRLQRIEAALSAFTQMLNSNQPNK